jgi:hypothetical protein
MLDTLCVPTRLPSLRRISPDGLSITRAGAEGVEGEANE